MALTMAEVARDYETDGVPSSGPHKIKKNNLRGWGAWVEGIINAFTANGGLIFASKASLDASLNYAANTMAWVLGDATVANNGIYRKIGASGTGAWTRVSDLPFSFIIASDAGAGTANAIQATTSIPVSGSALVWMNVFEANTSSPVTVSFNGGSVLTIKTNTGNNIAAGGLVAGMIVLGIVSGSNFRLVSDQASAAVLAAAEAAQEAASAAQAAAEAARDEALAAAPNIFALTRTALKALNTATITAAFLKEVDRYGQWLWKTGDYSTQIAADPNEGLYLKADAIAATAGAWVRQYDGRVFARWFGAGQAAIQAANALADDITIDRDFAITSTATWGNGKNYLFLGSGKLSVATAVTLTIRGVVHAGIWQGLPTSAPRKIFDCTGTGKVVGIRYVKPEWWGAVGDGATDDQPELQAAHDCVEVSRSSDGGTQTIELRGGAVYGLGSQLTWRPTADNNLNVVGAGKIFGGTRFNVLATFNTSAGTAGIRIDGNSNSLLMIADLDIGKFAVVRESGSAALVGLWVGGNGTTTNLIGVQQSPIHDVYVENFVFGYRIANCRLIDFNRCSAWCQNVASSVGCLVTVDGSTAFTGDMNFNDCQFVADPATGRKCVSIDNRIAAAQMKGIRFNNVIFYKGDRFLEIYAENGGLIGDIWVNPGCQFDGFGNTGVHIEANGSASEIDSVHVIGTYIRGINVGQVGIRIKSTSSGKIRDAHIRGNQIFSLGAGARAIIVEGLVGGSIDENVITDIDNPSNEAILIDSSSRFTACGNKLNRSGSQAVSWLISFGTGCDYFGYDMNIAGGIATVAPVRDLASTVNKLVGQNI